MRKDQATKQFGFTLIELIFTLAVLAVLVSIGTPSLGNLIHGVQSRSARGALIGSLNLARMTAVTARRLVIVCPSSNHAGCDDSLRWHSGWIVFEDRNQNNKRDADDPLLEVVGAQQGVAIATTAGRKFVRYRPDGSASGTDLTFTVCDRRGPKAAAAIVVNNPGRVREVQPDPSRAASTCASLGR